jgi:hypothetical protein
MSKRIAVYKDIEVELEKQASGDVIAAIALPSGPVWVSGTSETDAMIQIKGYIDAHLLGLFRRPLE